MVSFVKLSSWFLAAFIKPSRMLETIYTGINSKTEDVVPLDECPMFSRVCNSSPLS